MQLTSVGRVIRSYMAGPSERSAGSRPPCEARGQLEMGQRVVLRGQLEISQRDIRALTGRCAIMPDNCSMSL